MGGGRTWIETGAGASWPTGSTARTWKRYCWPGVRPATVALDAAVEAVWFTVCTTLRFSGWAEVVW
jgi:hypothetical protein